jgi:hypothetical protein
MSQVITLRLVSHHADGGGEIVRTRHIDTGEALIGRGPNNDIHLPDLSLDAQHALLCVVGTNRVSLESLGGQPFEVEGQSATRAELDVLKHPTARFGAYALAFALGDEGDIVVTVTHAEAGKGPTPALFSLKASLFGRRRLAWSFAVAILALCLIVPFAGRTAFEHLKIHPDQQWSTGSLSKAHAFLEQDCQACHVRAFVAVRDAACLSCHRAGRAEAVQARADARVTGAGSPFLPLLVADHAPHGRLLRALPPPPTIRGRIGAVFETALDHPRDRCASCHREHTTAPPEPTVARTADILRAGKPALVVVSDCAGCHARLKMRLPDTRLIDTPDWSRHPDFQPLVVTGMDGPAPRLQRISLSNHPTEANGLTFSHKVHMNPTGGVARQGFELGLTKGYGAALTCESCHRADGLGGFKPMQMERDCGACHSLAFAQVGGELKTLRHHDLRNIAGVLRGAQLPPGAPKVDPAVLRRGMQPGGLCVDCHTVQPSSGPFGGEIQPVRVAERLLPRGDFNHAVPAHAGLGAGAAQCADCHNAAASDRSSDLLLEGVATCRACHGKTAHETPRFAGTQCAECHGYHSPGQAPRTGQDRLFTALGAPAGTKPRGLPTF